MPSDLNKYACILEDQLQLANKQLEHADRTMLELIPYIEDYHKAELTLHRLRPHIERYGQLENLLTGPIENLASWYLQRERLEAQQDGSTYYQQPQQQIQQQQAQLPQYTRPEFPSMPTPMGSVDSWQALENVPIEQAWMVLDRMTPNDFQQRALVAQ